MKTKPNEESNNMEFSTFDDELGKFADGKITGNHIFKLGKPGEILQKCGFPKEHSIELSGSRLMMKAKQRNHPFDIKDVKGLDKAIQSPVAVFEYGNKEKSQNVIVELQRDEKNFLVGVFFNQKQRGYEVSDIRGLFNKDNIEWIRWIEHGKMIYGDKERIQVLAAQQRINFAEVNHREARTSSDSYYLDSVDSILQNFGDVKDIFTENFEFYKENKERYKIFKAFRDIYQGLESIEAADAPMLAKEFHEALKNDDTKTLLKYTDGEMYPEIAEKAGELVRSFNLEHNTTQKSTDKTLFPKESEYVNEKKDRADETHGKENKEMETEQNEESSNLITPKEYLKDLLSKAEIEVVEDTGVMRSILDEGKRVQKMAAKYGTNQDIDGEETFNGFGTYVVSVNEENARQLGIKIASKRYGGSFYINGEPFNEFLKEKNFSPYWESRLDQFKDHNVEYLADDFLRADVKGNTALEKERDTLTTLFSLGLVEYKREQAFLYSVDIPDNDSTNYLLYGNPIGIENANRINERLERMNVEWRVTRNDIGKNVYFNTLSEKVFGGSQESASKFLKEAGHVGMEMNSANYIVFDDKDMKVTNRVQYMIDGDSNVYGFAYDGKIYADPEIATSNTYAHEYTHLWDAYTQRTNPELWEKGKDIFKGTSLWNEVMTDENYQNLSNDDEILSECHSRIVGKMAESVLERIAERNGGILRDQVIDWDNEVAEYVAGELGAELAKPELESENHVSDSVRLEIAREFLSRPMKDLMEGRKIARNIPFQNNVQKMAEEYAFPDAREYFKFNKTDNENFGKALDKFDGSNPLQLIKVGEIPPVMKALGISDNPIEMPQSVVSKALREEASYPNDKKGHALTMEHVKKIPEALADPIMVFKSRTRDDSYVFFTEQKDESNRSIIIPVAVDKRYGRLVINEITSIYGRTNEVDFVNTNIEQGNLVYADKKRSLDWERECQIQFLAQVLPSEGSYSSILTKENLVNFVSAVGNEKIQKMAESVENEKDSAAFTAAQSPLDAQDTATAISTHIHYKDNIVEINNQELQEQEMEEDIASTRKTVKASEIFKDFEESMIFSGISQKDFDSAMLDYLHQRSAKEEAENGSFDTQDLMFDFLVAQKIHDERARDFALDKIEQYKGITVEFDADNIDLGYLSLSDREGAKEVEKELEELKVAHPTLVKNLSRQENPFLNADPEQVQELYEQAEAVEKMQQEAALTVEFDENGNPYYPKNEVAEESLQDKFRRENEVAFQKLDAYLETGEAPKNNEFLFESIPDVLKYAAVPDHEVVLTTGIITKARKTHQLSDEAIRKAISSLADPVAVFDSDRNRTENKSASIIAITDVESSSGKPVALSLNLDAQRKGFEQQYIVNEIRSVHDRTLIAKNGVNITEEWANAGLLRYVDDKKISRIGKEREDSFLLPLAKLDIESVLTKSDFVKQFDDKKISDWSKAAGVQSPLAVLQSDDNNIITKSDIVNNQNDFQKYSDEMDKGIEKIDNLQEKSTDEVQQNEGSAVQTAADQQTANPDDKRQDIAQTVDKDILPAFALVTKDGLKMFEGYRVQGFDNETRKYTVGNERGDSIRLDESTLESIRNPQNTIAAEKGKSVEAVQTQGAIVAGKTRVPEFAMITQNGLKEFKDMVVQKYSPSEKMWTLSNAEGEKVSVSENTFKELTSENQRSRAREFDENTPAYKKMLETQYNDYFKQRENTAANFIHNLSVYSRKEANSPIDAIRLSSVIIKQMSPGEKQKTKELLNTLCKDGETINGLIANTYLEAVKDKPLNEEYILSGRYKNTIARPMYDTISAKGEKVDKNFNLRVGDTISNVSFKAKKAFGVGSEKMVADWTVISASKQGNLITLKSGNSFRDVPRDTFLKQYSKQEKNERKQQVKERKRNTLNMDIER